MLMVSLELDQCPTSLLISALLAAFQLWSSKMYTCYQEWQQVNHENFQAASLPVHQLTLAPGYASSYTKIP